MATDFLMPKLGLTMEEGKIVEWLVAPGAAVEAGTAVMRIETDKVESDVEVPAGGTFHPTVTVGGTFKCGALIGYVLAEGEAVPVPVPEADAATPVAAQSTAAQPASPTSNAGERAADPARSFISPNARRVAAALGVDVSTVTGTGPGGRIVSEDVEAASAARPGRGSVPSATAAARHLADLLGVDLTAIAPDPDGRLSRDGVARYVRARLAAEAGTAPSALETPQPVTPQPAAAAPSIASTPLSQVPTEIRKFTGARGTIAKRMHAALQEMAQLTLFMDAEMDAVVADREARKASAIAPGFTDYIVSAAGRALRLHPIVNAQVTEQGIALLPDVHVGMAVAVPNGLMVPVVRHADRLALTDLAAETSRIAELGRAGKLKLADLEGGTFSVSALGMFGVDGFTPVINPPNVAILGVGRLRDEVVLRDGTVTTTKRLTISLTWDHRVLDGAPAAQFCQTIVGLLADPAALHAAPPEPS